MVCGLQEKVLPENASKVWAGISYKVFLLRRLDIKTADQEVSVEEFEKEVLEVMQK